MDLFLHCGSIQMRRSARVAWYVVAIVVAAGDVRAEPFTTCSQVATYLGSGSGSLLQRQERLAGAIAFTGSIAADPDQKCLDALVDRLLHDYAQSIDDYSTSAGLQNAQFKRNWASSAAQEWRKYVDWFLGQPAAGQDALVRAWGGKAEEADPPDVRRNRWLPKRVGAALKR